MNLAIRNVRLGAVLLASAVTFGWAGMGQAQFLLTGGSAGELQIGTGLPLPIGPAGIFLGGMTPVNGGTTCGDTLMTMGGCFGTFGADGPGTAYWPPLLVPPNPAASTGGAGTLTIKQTLGTPNGGAMLVPPGVLSLPAPGVPAPIAVFPTNPAVFQVATSIAYSWPAASATLAPGGAPAPAVLTSGGPAGGIIRYVLAGASNAFGGPGQFAIAAGPGAAGGRVPPNGTGQPPVASVWINAFAGAPGTVMTVAIVGASNPLGVAQPGASVGSPPATTMFGPVLNSLGTGPNGIGVVNVPMGGTACTMFCVGPAGTIASSLQPGSPFFSNMVTISKGFPWTTGFVTISQPGAGPPEIFFQSGTDMRVAGVGNVSLVSGALSVRALSGPNANRGWLSLNLVNTPEPMAIAGVAGSLAMLGICHTLVRRRRR